MLLYDERGLRLYDDITTAAPEYYLFGAEEQILKKHSDDIVQCMHSRGLKQSDEVVLELGAGALRKTSHILRGLARYAASSKLSSPITYYALDLEKRELERTLGGINTSEIGQELAGKVATKGICGTYDDGLKFIEEGGLGLAALQRPPEPSTFAEKFVARDDSAISRTSSMSDESSSEAGVSTQLSSPAGGVQPPLHIMFLGSSLGNFSRDDATAFLRALPLRSGAGDTLLLGLDHDNDKRQIELAYNDPQGYTKKFIMNGLHNAGRTLGDDHMFDEKKWEYVNRYDTVSRRHEAFYQSKCTQTVRAPAGDKVFDFMEDEMIKIEESVKYSEEDTYTMFTDANLRPVQRWMDAKGQYSLWLLERPPFNFPVLRSPSTVTQPGAHVLNQSKPFGMPSRSEWEDNWELWDHITLGMIPPSMLYERPIDLRHICLFYLGHIPTFLDIHLSRLLKEPHSEPEEFKYIFERGIDPDVEDPTQCHPHSEVPEKDEDWPSVDSILQFQARVRHRVMKLYDDLESGKVALTRKVARVLFMTFEHEAMHAETLLYMLLQRAGTGTLPPPGFAAPHWQALSKAWNEAVLPQSATVTLGPATVELGHDDNEPQDGQVVDQPVRDHEYGWDNEHPRRAVDVGKFSIEWRPVTNGEFYAFYTGQGRGKVDLPASWIEENDTVKVRTLYGPIEMEFAEHWPVIASYNDLSTYATVKGGRLPTEPELRLFYDKFAAGYTGGANMGFRNWHPVPATAGLDKHAGRGHNGGVWEWTSTVFDKVEGFQASPLYPGYSMDFFDDKHQVVLGGSYATIPRIAERRSFRNWYQRIYPYAWVGGRVAYDVPASA